jgi:hypothetical protein
MAPCLSFAALLPPEYEVDREAKEAREPPAPGVCERNFAFVMSRRGGPMRVCSGSCALGAVV